ncbi:multiple epidermal growth factor-like domains protein 10 [Maniola hyperantus]|uniref:multiple epidermal growth factor-like domains protein 10 n=1 Tax=Aphantopus hyperantus TaxID=2795564 RepID=UPI00212045F6
MRLKLLCVLGVLCFIHFTYVDGLKANDTGVCVITRSVKKTQRRMYIVKYKCGKKICTARRSKIKDYIVTQNDTLCCKGWTYSSDLDACSPLCSRGCMGGRCTAPDVCQCEPPATLDPETKNACYLPKCDPPCNNGACLTNNTCTCLHGYEKVNNTCQPKCEECQNGRCISPNICECNEGYIKEDNKCNIRKCEPPCNNGLCTENNTCTCVHGYEKVKNTCQPTCDFCRNGRCTGHNVCECYPDYIKYDGVCKPLCINDLSLTRSMCKCGGDYQNDNSSCFEACREECLVCDPEGQCIRRKVCGAGEIEIVCCDGYSWEYDKKAKREFCKPICRPSCGKHGECVKYNQCKCKPPYEFREGTCLLPETCENPCINGRCTGFNTCACNTGYKPRNASYCEPECPQPCINSICVAPNTCNCINGFKRKNQWECTPECNECGNGQCIGPYICKCNDGYVRQGNKCVPICEGNCPHGQCLRPGECICNAGYINDPIHKLTCRPSCEPGCVNGTCDAPNRCACFPGYTHARNVSVCKPKCDYCSNGDCIGPNICNCHEGYTMMGKKCKPVCSKTCVNGFCSEPNKCTCLPGYNNDDIDKFVCKPECEACENGKCTSPGLCSCNEGYEKLNGTCKPVCSKPCVNGYCKLPNECSCPAGYTIKTTVESSVCYRPCSVPCTNGVCGVNGECICPYGSGDDNECRPNMNETIDCKSCEGNCTDNVCRCSDGRPCELITKAPSTGLAGLELTWILGACIGLLLFIFVIAIMGQMWRKRPNVKATYTEGNQNGSVGFLTAPGTLTNRMFSEDKTDEDFCDIDLECGKEEKDEMTSERLLHGQVIYEDERL